MRLLTKYFPKTGLVYLSVCIFGSVFVSLMHPTHINTEKNEVIFLSFPCEVVFLSTLAEMHLLALNTGGHMLALTQIKTVWKRGISLGQELDGTIISFVNVSRFNFRSSWINNVIKKNKGICPNSHANPSNSSREISAWTNRQTNFTSQEPENPPG